MIAISLKRALGALTFTLLVFCFSVQSQAGILLSDDFENDGTLNGQSPSIGGKWKRVSGTANQIQVIDNRVRLSDADTEDVTSLFDDDVDEGKLYYAFNVIVTDPGKYTGTDSEYFAHWKSDEGHKSLTEVAAFSASGWRPGHRANTSEDSTVWGSDLDYGTDYRIVVGYNFSNGKSTLWVDPTSKSDTSITSTESEEDFDAEGFNFRQSNSTPNQQLSIGNLRVAKKFDQVLYSSSAGAAVPEPSMLITLSLIGILGFAHTRRRRVH